jgi:hypothetical protein
MPATTEDTEYDGGKPKPFEPLRSRRNTKEGESGKRSMSRKILATSRVGERETFR